MVAGNQDYLKLFSSVYASLCTLSHSIYDMDLHKGSINELTEEVDQNVWRLW